VREDKEHLTITVDLPGVKPEDVKISVEGQVLTVRGEKRQVSEQTDERWHRYERSYGSFERSFTLPSTVDADRIQATAEHGVLTISLPKIEKAKPREIPVKASTGVFSKPETVSTTTNRVGKAYGRSESRKVLPDFPSFRLRSTFSLPIMRGIPASALPSACSSSPPPVSGRACWARRADKAAIQQATGRAGPLQYSPLTSGLRQRTRPTRSSCRQHGRGQGCGRHQNWMASYPAISNAKFSIVELTARATWRTCKGPMRWT
jgi:hypothetical protein